MLCSWLIAACRNLAQNDRVRQGWGEHVEFESTNKIQVNKMSSTYGQEWKVPVN